MTEEGIRDAIKNGFELQHKPTTGEWRLKHVRDIRFPSGPLCRELKEKKKIDRTGLTGLWQNFVFTDVE